MIVSRLLKSCATPPASRPTASILCAWRRRLFELLLLVLRLLQARTHAVEGAGDLCDFIAPVAFQWIAEVPMFQGADTGDEIGEWARERM